MPDIFRADQPQPETKPAPEEEKQEVQENEPKGNNKALSAFMVRPKGVKFETQETAEDILFLMRRHPVTNLAWIIMTIILAVIPLVVLPIVIGVQIFPEQMPGGYLVMLPAFWYLGICGYAFTNFLNWYYNVYIVTNRRVVDIDWVGLLYKQLSSAQLAKVQDVTYKQGGMLDTFFNFGTVYIQTAGAEPNFEFDAVPQPNQVVKQINRIIEARRTGSKRI